MIWDLERKIYRSTTIAPGFFIFQGLRPPCTGSKGLLDDKLILNTQIN